MQQPTTTKPANAPGKTVTPHKNLRQIVCAPDCGFLVRSGNDKEIINAAQFHIKGSHPDMRVDENGIRGMIKPA